MIIKKVGKKEQNELKEIKNKKFFLSAIFGGVSVTLLIMVLIIFILSFAVVFIYLKYKDVSETNKVLYDQNSVSSKEDEAQKVIAKFSQIYLMPEEEPTVATITDIDKLKSDNADFYKDAKNGDKVIIFVEAKLAFLYRYEDNKILKIAPVSFESTDTNSQN